MVTIVSALACFLLLPVTALAHSGGELHTFLQGVVHPLSGLDHLLALLCVGLLAGRMQGCARWLLPSVFLASMSIGGVAGAYGIAVPFVEEGIALSLVVFGLASLRQNQLAAIAKIPGQLPLRCSLPVIGLFALLHGHAHGSAIEVGASGLLYGSGFTFAAATLLVIGRVLARALEAPGGRPVQRL